MRATTSRQFFPRVFSGSFLLIALLAALVGMLMPAAPALAAPILWVDMSLAPGTPTPIPAGQAFRLRLTYECSSSFAGDSCTNLQVASTLPVQLEGLQVVGNSDVQLASYDSGTHTATWIFNSPLPLGTTGQLDFEVRYLPGVTVDGEPATVTATIDAAGATPTNSAPLTVIADAADQSTVTKVVESGGAAGDLTSYRIDVCTGGAGGLSLTNATITDTLPLGAVYVSSNPPAASVDTVSTPQTVVWDGANVAASGCDVFRVTVNYPSSDPSNAVGASKTNAARVAGTPFGTAEKIMNASVAHTLAPPSPGFALDKTADADTIVGGAVETQLRVRNTGNVQLDDVIITDPVPAEQTVNRIDTGAATAVEYRKNGDTTWITGVPLGSNVLVGSFPGFIAGDYVSGLRFTLGTIPVSFDNSGSRIYSTVVNPPNGGGAAYTLPHNVTNIATLSGSYAGSPLTDKSDGATTEVDVPKARPTPQKVIVSGSPALPGQTVRYGLTMANGNFAPLDNPVIADLLPSQVTYVPGSWTLTKSITGCASTPPFSATPNFNGSGRTLLRWSWAGSGCSIASGDDARVEFNVTVNIGTYPTGASSIANRLALVDFSTPTTLVRRANCIAADPTELAIYTGAGYNAAKLCFSSPAGLSINAAASLGSAKYVKGQLDSVFHRDPNVGATVRGGQITYQMELSNSGNVDFQNLQIVDVLPYNTPAPGNVGVRDLVALGTAWTPQLAGPVAISPPIPGLTVRYSTEINPCRPNLAPSNPGCVPMVDGVAPGAGVWSLNLPSNPTAVRSIKFDFGSYVLLANQAIRFTFPMFAPANAPLAGAGPNNVLGDNDDTNVAWNTFAYEAVRVDDGSRLVAQPPRVGIEVQATPAGLASYGDYVWNDVNQNGSQDEPPYRGINGVTVRLYDDADGNPATTGDQTLLGTQITHDDAGGNPGYYLFPALSPGFYFAEFVAPAGFQPSPRDTTADTIDSDINTVTGRTAITQLTAGENDLTWDAGFYGPAVGLGNRVWFDTNNDRLDNDGAGAAAGSSTGIPGVSVELYLDANGDGQITGAEQNWLAQATTDASGFYLFNQQTHSSGLALSSPVPLYPGQYIVGIAPDNFVSGALVGYHSSGTTISTAGVIGEVAAPDANDDTDRDDNGDTVRTPAVFYSGGVLGKPIHIDSSEPTGEPESAGNAPGPLPIADNNSNLTLDFGFYTTSLGNLVWMDDGAGGGTIANGLRDGGEAGLAGVTVRLFSQDNTTEIRVGPDGVLGSGDDAALGMLTSAGGAYRFGGLPQGQYRVRMTAPSGYVSTRDTSGTSSPNGNIDNDDNGPGVNSGTATSSVITLTPGAAGILNNNTVNAAAGSTLDPTIDFGIVHNYSLGNRVWNDLNNNGLRDGGELGISSVVLRLYLSDGVTIARRIDGSNVPDSTTNATGYYRFDNLPVGDYIVEVLGSNFTGANPLVGFHSSIGAAGAYEPAGDPDDDIDDDDDGTFASGVARSQAVTLGEGSGTAEPVSAVDGDGGVVSSPEANDNQSNRTVDFGFYATLSLGNRVWEDADNNGAVNGAEAGISGVVVNLYRDSNDDSLPDGAAIAATTTNATGYYLFTGLVADTYLVEIVPPTGYTSSTGNFGTYEPAPDADSVATDSDDNGSAGAGVIRSAPVVLSVGGEPTGEPATPGLADDARDNNGNYTVDFGLFRPLALGNLAWLDADNNGVVSGGETGIAGVTVRLYRDSDTNGSPDDLAAPAGITPADAIRSMTTNGSGHYLFTELGAGDYIAEAVTPAGLTSSTGQTLPAAYEPGPDADTFADDDDDNGSANGSVVRSAPVTLSFGGEPIGEPATPGLADTTPDNSSNLTVDFGFFQPLRLGNLVFEDVANDGVYDAGSDSPLAGALIELFASDGSTPALDADGVAVGSQTTTATGLYLFTNLAPGQYVVRVTPPLGYVSSSDILTSGNPDNDTDDDDNGLVSAGVVTSAPVTLTSSGEPPVATDTDDTSGNLTLDFGFFLPAELGDVVWLDANHDGVQDGKASEPGIPGVAVTLARPGIDGTPGTADDVVVASTTTGADGDYLFTNLGVGNYFVTFALPAGYARSPLGGTADSTLDSDADLTTGRTAVTTLATGESDLAWDAGIYFTASLGDRVWLDKNGNGIQDSGEPGIPNVTVTLHNSGGAVVGTPATTDASGNYGFPSLAPGDYYVEFTPPAGYAISPADRGADDAADSDASPLGTTAVTTIALGEADPSWDAGLYLPVSLGNLVWNDINNNGLAESGEPLIGGVLVNLYRDANANGRIDAGEGVASTTTAGGLYLFDKLIPAVYIVQLDPSNFTRTGALAGFRSSTGRPGTHISQTGPFEPAPDPDSDRDDDDNGTVLAGQGLISLPITLSSNDEPITDGDASMESNLTVDFGLFMPASLGNLVWYDTNRDGVHDRSEAGVPGVVVTLYDAAGSPIASATTASDGFFEFNNLAPGAYSVGFSALPADYTFTLVNQGGDDRSDSDADPSTGLTTAVVLVPGENNPTLYAGLVPVTPTAIALASFSATNAGASVAVRWQTTAEINTWGFYLYRSADGKRSSAVRVTPKLIAAEGRGQAGASYAWTDSAVEQAVSYSYWLVEVELNGATNEYGPATARPHVANTSYHAFLPLAAR